MVHERHIPCCPLLTLPRCFGASLGWSRCLNLLLLLSLCIYICLFPSPRKTLVHVLCFSLVYYIVSGFFFPPWCRERKYPLVFCLVISGICLRAVWPGVTIASLSLAAACWPPSHFLNTVGASESCLCNMAQHSKLLQIAGVIASCWSPGLLKFSCLARRTGDCFQQQINCHISGPRYSTWRKPRGQNAYATPLHSL